MIAIIVFKGKPNLELKEGDAELLEFFQARSGVEWALAVLSVVFLAYLIHGIFSSLLPRRQHAAPANTLPESVLGLLLFLVLGQIALSTLDLIGLSGEKADPSLRIILRLSATAVTLVLSLLALRILAEERQRGSFSWWGMRREGIVPVLLVIPLAMVAFAPIHVCVAHVWRYILLSLEWDASLQPVLEVPIREGGAALPVVFVLAVTVVPVLEEVLFRGAVYRALREHVGAVAGAVISAALFAACHFNLGSLAPIFVLALLLAFAYEWSGSLWAPILAHALFNFLKFGWA